MKSLARLLNELTRRDIVLRREGDQVWYSAPKGALTPALRAQIQKQKAEILALLREREETERDVPSPIGRAPRDRPLPLSMMQEGLWFLHKIAPDSAFYNLPVAVRMTGELDVSALKKALNKIRCGCHVLEPLLVLDADCSAAKFVRNSHGRDIHLELFQQLGISQLCLFIGPCDKDHSAVVQPSPDLLRFVVGNFSHRSNESRLTQPFFVNSRRIQQFVIDDGVVHPHAAFVKNSENGFLSLQL